MQVNMNDIGSQKVRSVANKEEFELRSFWQDQGAVIVFFRRWGCMFCRLWATELNQISAVLKKNNIKLIGVGVEEQGSKEFIDGNFFDGDLYYVDNLSTYQNLGFKKFSTVGILASLLWKQSREAVTKSNQLGVGGDLKGDWGQTGGLLLVERDGKLKQLFAQTGPAEHYPNEDILKAFDLSHEYKEETMSNIKRDDNQCKTGN